MYVVDRLGFPVGVVKKQFLEQVIRLRCEDITSVMLQYFPVANASTNLESIFHLYQLQLPVAVVDESGFFKGIVEPSDVLASISRLKE